jgi:hypothetical protein
MSIFNLFGSKTSDLYSDTNSDGDEDAYIYRLESDGSYTPVSKDEYKAHTDQLFRDGYYDDIIKRIEDDESTSKKGWFGLW